MHLQSEKELQILARDFIKQQRDHADAWQLFREEAQARYSAEDDGPSEQYSKDVAEIFDVELFTLAPAD
jgi:hypothetical protein